MEEISLEIQLTEKEKRDLIKALSVGEGKNLLDPEPRNRAERRKQKKHEWLVGGRGGGKSWVNGQK